MSDQTVAYDGAPVSPLVRLFEDQVLGLESMLLELRLDPEGAVHDARVALRRLRSSLSLYSRSLGEAAASLRRELTWLAGMLGPARDAQVLLGRMRQAVEIEGPHDPDGERLLARFEREEREAFEAARTTLDSDRFIGLLALLDTARLRTLVLHDEGSEELANHSLERLLGVLETTDGAADEDLHELRKAVKRVRYTRGRQDVVDQALKTVQGVLGEHQDTVVARQRLGELEQTPLVRALVTREEALADRTLVDLKPAVQRLRAAAASLP